MECPFKITEEHDSKVYDLCDYDYHNRTDFNCETCIVGNIDNWNSFGSLGAGVAAYIEELDRRITRIEQGKDAAD